MIRRLLLVGVLAACGKARGVPDQDLGGLVIETKKPDAPIDLDKAAKDPAELGRALERPYAVSIAALGPHALAISSSMSVSDGTKLDDKSVLELGEAGAFHGTYTNSADYGRETIYLAGTPASGAAGAPRMFLKPRYQKWHGRAPESADEPAELRDAYADALFATWDLLAPAVEVTDRGVVTVAGRTGRKIEVKLAPSAVKMPAEALVQRKWRETRTVTAVAGEVVLDAEKGVPLAEKLSGTVSFQREGKRYDMTVTVDGAVTKLGPTAIAAPAETEVVATPERLREVEERDQLLQGIAPPVGAKKK